MNTDTNINRTRMPLPAIIFDGDESRVWLRWRSLRGVEVEELFLISTPTILVLEATTGESP
jgi:hypothetical protein